MSMYRRNLVAAVILVLLTFVCRADDGWKMPNLNPFAAKDRTSGRASSPPTSGWHMPKIWPSAPAKGKKTQASTLHKMTTGTQKMISKTADALTPWDNKKPSPPPKITGSNSIFTQQSQPKKEEKSGSILPASWWSSDSEPKKPQSVNEFLAQPRPH
jgi:hypothetical protein